MHRIDGPGAAPGNLFTAGDPALAIPATEVTPEWANAVQEEVVNVILAAGIALDKPTNNQLESAINALILAQIPPPYVPPPYTRPHGYYFFGQF